MARTAKPTKSTPPAAVRRGPGRPRKTPAAAPKTAKAVAAPKLSKEDLRLRVEKLERANATLRAKGKDATRAAKEADARIADLEAQVAQMEKKAPSKPAASPTAKTTSKRGPKRSREIDPGDAVPPGVAVEDPEPMDEEATEAKESLEEHFHGE